MRFGLMLAAAAATMACAGQASAADINTFGVSALCTTTYCGLSGSIQQFDPALGQLQYVTISGSYQSDTVGYVSVSNTSNPITGTFSSSFTENPTLTFGNFRAVFPSNNQSQTQSGSNQQYLDFQYRGIGSSTLTSDFSQFIGTGTIQASASRATANIFNNSNNPNVYFYITDVGTTYNFVVHYNYVAAGAVTEPATWLMMIAGVGCVGATLRRRRKPVSAPLSA